MMDTSSSTEKKQVEWRNEILEFIKVYETNEDKEREEFIYYDGECFYCGQKKSVDKLKRQLLQQDWICDECYRKRILKRVDAAYLADQSLKMLSLMYGIYPWKRFKVRFKRKLFKAHQYPWDKYDVVYKKWITKYDRMYVRKKLPEETAEAAIVSVLLEQYLIIRGKENEIWDFFAKSMESEAAGQGDIDVTSKGNFWDTDRKSRQGIRNGLVIWCTIHYLRIVRDKNCAEQYEKQLSDVEKRQYAECKKRLDEQLEENHIQHIRMEEILDILDNEKKNKQNVEENSDGT